MSEVLQEDVELDLAGRQGNAGSFFLLAPIQCGEALAIGDDDGAVLQGAEGDVERPGFLDIQGRAVDRQALRLVDGFQVDGLLALEGRAAELFEARLLVQGKPGHLDGLDLLRRLGQDVTFG